MSDKLPCRFPSLAFPGDKPWGDTSHHAVRLAQIDEAKAWPSGASFETRVFTEVSTFPATYSRGEPLSVRLGKPGKEAFRTKNPNPLDMTPAVFRGELNLNVTPTFELQWGALEQAARSDPLGAELIGSLLVRAAFVLDHREVGPGIWRYQPPAEVLDYIKARTPELLGIPTRAFLHMFDAIALNEDVKFVGSGAYPIKKDVGRVNNLLTAARVMAALLGRISWASVAGELSRRPSGVAPLKEDELKCFPCLFT
jgi:hypothetical protein